MCGKKPALPKDPEPGIHEVAYRNWSRSIPANWLSAKLAIVGNTSSANHRSEDEPARHATDQASDDPLL
jgi:hypothetical protein